MFIPILKKAFSKDLRSLVKMYISNDSTNLEQLASCFNKLQMKVNNEDRAKFAMRILDSPEESVQEKERARNYLSNSHSLNARIISLRDITLGHVNRRQKLVDDIIELLTPIQAAKLCIWVENNPLCIQMLNTTISSFKKFAHNININRNTCFAEYGIYTGQR